MRARVFLAPGGLLFFLVLLFSGPLASAQSPGRSSSQTVAPNILPDTRSSSEFPLWAQDLRRGEIIAFGSFPFTMFVSGFTMDSIRYFKNNRDSRYLPWPLKGPGAVEMTREEREKTILAAVIASVALAAIDFTIVQVKRNQARKLLERQERGAGIQIIQGPVAGDEPEEPPEAGDESPEESP